MPARNFLFQAGLFEGPRAGACDAHRKGDRASLVHNLTNWLKRNNRLPETGRESNEKNRQGSWGRFHFPGCSKALPRGGNRGVTLTSA